jgi:hypothetical protein
MNGIRMAACQRMFGEELPFSLDWLATFGITDIYSVLYVLFPRRGGKSTTQQVGMAAQAMTQTDGHYIALSLFARQGWDWLESCKMYASQLKDHERWGYTVVTDNKTEYAIIPKAVGTTNSVRTYPGATSGGYDNLRGIGKKVCNHWMHALCV